MTPLHVDIIIPHLKDEEDPEREYLARGLSASQLQNQGEDPGSLAPKPICMLPLETEIEENVTALNLMHPRQQNCLSSNLLRPITPSF